jgi:hypothetical protein
MEAVGGGAAEDRGAEVPKDHKLALGESAREGDHGGAKAFGPIVETQGAEPHYLLVVRREKALDSLEVRVEARADLHAAGPEAAAALGTQIRRRLHEGLGITVEVTVLPPKTLERSVGKAQRVRDLRTQA